MTRKLRNDLKAIAAMANAPLDGTHVLLKVRTYGFSIAVHGYVPTGFKVIEGFYGSGWAGYGWQEWCGNEATRSTGLMSPVNWAPIPEHLK
jgi:hypothetical protein